MFNAQSYNLGSQRSCIRELFEYGVRRAAIVGKDKVFDFSLGNPCIPSPAQVGQTIAGLLTDTDSLALHGYTTAVGDIATRQAIADDLNGRFGTQITPQELFIGCGAAPELCAVFRALAVPQANIVAFAPYFPEYKPFAEQNGLEFRVVAPNGKDFSIPVDGLDTVMDENTVAVIFSGTAPMKCFVDAWESYSTNEITIYWNSSAIFTTAFLRR